MTCWVIEQGEYSDYRVVGVFTSKANAEKVAEALCQSTYDPPRISEWPLDPAVDALNAGHTPYLVKMRRDGEVESVTKEAATAGSISYEPWVWPRSIAPAYAGKNLPDLFCSEVWAADEADAVKIVNEQRTKLIALGGWS